MFPRVSPGLDAAGKWTIYEEGDALVLRTNGSCVAVGRTQPCMWYAVAFDFIAASEKTALQCTSRASEPIDNVTPGKMLAEQTREFTYAAELSGLVGRVVWPGYSIADGKPSSITMRTTCEHNGTKVLTFEFTITEPPDSTAARDARNSGARPSR